MKIKKYIDYLEHCYGISNELDLKLIFSLHQTSNQDHQEPYTLPPRKSKKIILCGVCNLGQEEIIEITNIFQSKINYFLVDLEKKGIVGTSKAKTGLITGNLEGRLAEIVPKDKILGIRYDSLTAEHLINLIVKNDPFIYKSKIGLIGLGKIGFKIAISLLECGNNIEVFARDYDLLYRKCACMDLIKPNSTLARPIPHRKIESCLNEKDIIITATNSKNVIEEKYLPLIKNNSTIYSVGHGEISNKVLKFLEERNTKICRVDIGLSIINYLERLVLVEEINPKLKIINGKRFVSGGYLGISGDIVVDDVDSPNFIYGYISEEGGFVREMKKFNV
tara:strand:+ start:747 stop:1751 length:1005 start_codon:yes stop_codon:yes gene_type:complete